MHFLDISFYNSDNFDKKILKNLRYYVLYKKCGNIFWSRILKKASTTSFETNNKSCISEHAMSPYFTGSPKNRCKQTAKSRGSKLSEFLKELKLLKIIWP